MNQQPRTLDGELEDMPRLGEIGLQNFAPYLMNRIMDRYNAGIQERMAEVGLTTAKIRALAVLSVIGGLQIGHLAVYAVVEQSTLSRALDALMAEGLIRRQADLQDSRATRVYITDAGRDAFEVIWPAMAETYAQMFAEISPEEREAFVATLHKILANVRKHDF